MEVLRPKQNNIKENHFLEWKNSAVSQDIIELNVKSLSGDNIYEFLTYGVTREERRNDGRLPDKHLARYKQATEGGWYCAGIDLVSLKDCEWGCFKPDKPRKTDGKIVKYEHPCSVPTELFALKVPDRYWVGTAKSFNFPIENSMSFWEWVLNNPLPVLITEGAKKAGCLLTAGYIAVALPGVFNGFRDGELHPQLKALCKIPREIIFCFDQDPKWQTKISITQAIKKTGQALEVLDCDVFVMVWDGKEGKGIDDFCIKNPGLDKLNEIYDLRLALEKYLETNEQVRKLNRPNFLKFLEITYKNRLAFNELTDAIELDSNTNEPLELTGEMCYKLIETHLVDVSFDDLYYGFTHFAKKRSYHPVARYLESCKNLEDISLDNLANRYFGIDPNDYNSNLYNIFIRKWMIAAVARIFEPGCKFDHALILQGNKHGSGKSTFFQVLGGDWHDSSANANVDNPKTLMVFHRCWIQEWDEFDKVTNKGDAGVLKSFIVNRVDRFVRPYGRAVQNHKRRFIIAGTVNRSDFLMDETGNRRCLIIPLPREHRVPNKELVKPERDRLWGAAMRAYLKGKEQGLDAWVLTPQEEQATNDSSLRFMVADGWEDAIDDYLTNRGIKKVTVAFVMEKILDIELKDREPKYERRVTKILTLLGWTSTGKRETDPETGERARFWYAP